MKDITKICSMNEDSVVNLEDILESEINKEQIFFLTIRTGGKKLFK